jgi:hypothetical protein
LLLLLLGRSRRDAARNDRNENSKSRYRWKMRRSSAD